jgi:hypothetical protein
VRELCQHCKEREATQSMPWYLLVPAFTCDGFAVFEPYCEHCASARKAFALVVLAVAALLVFFIAVISL